jgi:hypothetical protein
VIRLRQVALLARDLDAARAEVEVEVEASLGLEVCNRDPGVGVFGLHNVLFHRRQAPAPPGRVGASLKVCGTTARFVAG